MPRQLPPLNALRAFEAAARLGSYTSAARELNVSHAAISRHVGLLEHRLGIALFRKASRGVELTERGQGYAADITAALDAIADATGMLGGRVGGTIAITAEPTFAMKWLVPRLGQFSTQHPDIDVRLDSSHRLADFKRHEADIGIRSGNGHWPDVEATLIDASPVRPYGAKSLKGRRRRPWLPAEIATMPLLHEDDGGLWRRWFVAAGLPDAVPPASVNRLETLLAIEAAAAGQGLALACESLIAAEVVQGRLVAFSDKALADSGYFLVTSPGARKRRTIASFCNWLLAATAYLRQT